jgi:Mn2+/Fe2+ NRAMP family transporter
MIDSKTAHDAIPLLAARIAQRRASLLKSHKGPLGRLGPGLITGASDDDPSGIATYSQTGAQFGYAMCWVMLFCFPLMAAIQEISARMGRASGQGIAGNIRAHHPRMLLYVIVGLLLLANTINLGADLGAMAAALKLLVGGAASFYVVGFAVGCAWLEVFSPYQRYVSILKWGSFVLLAYVAVALVVDVPWKLVLYSTFVPSFSLQKDYVVTVVAVLGTTITPYCFFWQSSQEAEDERVDPTAYALIDAPEQAPAEISRMRFDTYIGMGYSNVISLFIIVATAATLNAHGVTDIQTSAQAAEALRPIAGFSHSPCSQRALSASACSRFPCSPPPVPTRSARRSAGLLVSTANRSTPRYSTSRSRFQPLSESASTSSASIRSRRCSGRR